ncbi:MAG: ROK family transcriptional regulator [Candidatus Pelethousia sp.]|nr:ROK family transcriptional regulator [Candidatus Pelethousia sp.]
MKGIYKLDQESMRQNNARMIFEAIYRSEGVTKNELAAATGLSVMAVSRIVDLLAEQDVIVEKESGENGRLGRPAKRVYIKRESIVNVGVSLDVGGVYIGAVDPYGRILQFESHSLPLDGNHPHEALREITELVHTFLRTYGLLNIPSVGLVMPGIIDYEKGYLRLASQLRWEAMPVASLMESYAPIPKIILENDVKARAQAENRFGSSKGYDSSVLLTIGSGIGAGVIINNSIYRGKDNMAGEIGHSVLCMNNRMCECGRMGCAQATISEPALMREARRVDPSIEMEGLIAAYRAGLPWAERLLHMTAEYILMLLSLLANAYAPEAIILCGSLMDRCVVLRELVSQSFQQEQAQFLNPTFDIGFSEFGPDGNIIGAATVAFNHNIDNRILAYSFQPQAAPGGNPE